ncbi:S-layer homology domain-containing protein [Paenibacillus alba]|uniref:S-layer homology domain-containing protein n=1 Tax=Paenibacillus alba TaxID=1197127 RepID=UPI001567C1B4|nr:S-layer homology domain-containing protein [Paenibacillus alba]NQX69038.1 S-layer homology domain-containing protein [Paenibacillus alba]
MMYIRKLLSCSTVLSLLVFLLLPQFTFATNNFSYNLEVSKVNPTVGDQITVVVNGNNLTDVHAYELDLAYDPSLLQYVSGSKVNDSGFTNSEAKANGHIKFLHTELGDTNIEDGTVSLATLTFDVIKKGSASIQLISVEPTNSQDEATLQTVNVNKSIEIADKSNPGTGSGGGGGGGGIISPSNPNTDKEGKHVVTLEELSKPAENGKVIVPVSADMKQVALPSNTAELLGLNQLEIKMDQLTLDVPVALIKQLTSGVSADTLKDSMISLKFEPLSASAATDALAKGQAESQAAIKLGSDVYEFELSLIKSDGSTIAVLSKFDQPITIRLKVDASINPKLAGIYYIADDGKLEFIGGQYSNGEMTAQISHFSKYAVLEVTKAFADVPNGHWAADVIKELVAKQIVNGTSATTFEPGRSVTRAEFTSLLVRALKLTGTGQLSFTDVHATDWYEETIAIAVKAGVVNGKSETIFDPNAQITREEMVTMMMRAYAIVHGSQSTGNVGTSFTDEAEVSTWAVQFVNQAAELHLVQGRSAGVFDPKGITTRAEAAQVIYNVLMK